MACPVCGRVLCDHSPAERGQTGAEMMADMYADAPSPRGKGSVPAARKPPAHEVILARLQEVQEELRKPRIIGRLGLQVVCQALLDVLAAMHLPEQERPKILEALRALNPEVIGAHKSRVQLLKELTGHSIEHVIGR